MRIVCSNYFYSCLSRYVYVSRLEEVGGDARIGELVRMLGASGSTAEAHARELLMT